MTGLGKSPESSAVHILVRNTTVSAALSPWPGRCPWRPDRAASRIRTVPQVSTRQWRDITEALSPQPPGMKELRGRWPSAAERASAAKPLKYFLGAVAWLAWQPGQLRSQRRSPPPPPSRGSQEDILSYRSPLVQHRHAGRAFPTARARPAQEPRRTCPGASRQRRQMAIRPQWAQDIDSRAGLTLSGNQPSWGWGIFRDKHCSGVAAAALWHQHNRAWEASLFLGSASAPHSREEATRSTRTPVKPGWSCPRLVLRRLKLLSRRCWWVAPGLSWAAARGSRTSLRTRIEALFTFITNLLAAFRSTPYPVQAGPRGPYSA